jgi:polyphosphate kinase
MGFCTEEEYKKFLKGCPAFENVLISNGIILLKYWLDVSEKEQHKRFLARIQDPSKRWKLEPNGPRVSSPLVRLFAGA